MPLHLAPLLHVWPLLFAIFTPPVPEFDARAKICVPEGRLFLMLCVYFVWLTAAKVMIVLYPGHTIW